MRKAEGEGEEGRKGCVGGRREVPKDRGGGVRWVVERKARVG